MAQWKIDIYPEDDSDHSFNQYYESLESGKDKALILAVVKILEDLGSDISETKMDGLIEGPLRELRKGRHRIIYGHYKNKYVLLVAFLKETKKTPQKYIELAKRRFRTYKNLKEAN